MRNQHLFEAARSAQAGTSGNAGAIIGALIDELERAEGKLSKAEIKCDVHGDKTVNAVVCFECETAARTSIDAQLAEAQELLRNAVQWFNVYAAALRVASPELSAAFDELRGGSDV